MAKKIHAEVRKKGQHLTKQNRYDIERYLRKGWSVKQIAEAIGCCLATVYNEIKRGEYMHTIKDGAKEEPRYAAELSWNKYTDMLKKKGTVPKLAQDPELVEYLRVLLQEQKYSPAAALMKIEAEGKQFKVKINSVNTIYTGIARGLIKGVTLNSLPDGGHHRVKKETDEEKKNKKKHKRTPKGDIIENRPAEVEDRLEFGHWEMDTVKGQIRNRNCLLVLTERKTRYEIIEKMKACNTDEVRKALNRIEKRYGSSFYSIFQTITVDNGVEFQDCDGMQKALYRVGNRTKIFYCHPYTSCERGSNEVQNRLIRRFFRKGANFDSILNRKKVKEVESWINEMPRKILNGLSSKKLFDEQCMLLSG